MTKVHFAPCNRPNPQKIRPRCKRSAKTQRYLNVMDEELRKGLKVSWRRSRASRRAVPVKWRIRKPTIGLLALLALLAACLAARSALQVTQGLQAEYFLDDQPAAPPAMTLVSREVSTALMAEDWNGAPPPIFRARWFGYFTIGREGPYTFATTSDDGSRLLVDGQLVVDNGGTHGMQTATGRTQLTPGPHFVLIEYQQAGGDYGINWAWAADGSALARVPGWVLSPRRVSHARAVAARVLDLASFGVILILGLLISWLAIEHGRGPAWRVAQQRPRLASLALFAVLTIIQTWPLASDPAHLSRNDNGDTMLNEWTLAWVAHQAPRAPLRLYDGNIFYPERDTLAYSEAMIVQSAMAAPLLWLGASPVLAYNMVLLAGFTLTAWAASLVVTRWTGDRVAGILSGTLAGFNAHTISRLPHLQAQHGEFLPLALFALDQLLREPRASHALRLACWFTLQALTSVYLLVFTAFGLTAGALARPDTWTGARFRRVAPLVALAAGVAALMLLPFLVPYWRAYSGQGLTRSLDEARAFAASGWDYLTTPGRIHGEWWSHDFPSATSLFPGFAAMALTAVALASRVAFRDPRARMCLAMGICGVALSFGAKLPGYESLYRAVPLLHAIRAPVRFGYLGIVAVALLAGFGLAELRRRLPVRQSGAIAAVALALAIIEPFRAPLYLPRFDAVAPIYRQLRDVPEAVVVELPFPHPWAVFHNAKYMLNSTAHWKPMVNGYSGFVPNSYREHYEQLAGFPSEKSIAALQALRVTHVFVHVDQLGADVAAQLGRMPVLTRLAAEGPVVLYRLARIE